MDQERIFNKTKPNSHGLCINYDVALIIETLSYLLKKAPQSVKDKYKLKIKEKAIERLKKK